MEMCYNGALAMPSKYATISNEEMEYLDGGVSFSRSWVSVAVDCVAMLFCPYLAPIKFMGKNAAKALVSKFLPNITGAFSKILKSVLGVGINASTGKLGSLIFGNLWCLTSVGGIVSLAADYFSDKKLDARVCF